MQLGLPELEALGANRMPHRWLAVESPPLTAEARAEAAAAEPEGPSPAKTAVALHCDFDALPFESASLDLVVLPHSLELARDPHLTLREVERVLVPEGRVLILGFNPASLWGLRQRLGRMRRRLGLGTERDLFLPRAGEFIGYRRLRDWLRLLELRGRVGPLRLLPPAVTSAKWLARFGWMERAGDRWWPVFGAVYFIVAVKRVRGMRLIGLVRDEARPKAVTAPAPVAATQRRDAELETHGDLR